MQGTKRAIEMQKERLKLKQGMKMKAGEENRHKSIGMSENVTG